MHVLIVDDELLARQRLTRMVGELEDHELVGEASNGTQALELIDKCDPDIVLLDIRMPGEDGLMTARKIADLPDPPAIIFCTAYEEYALEAFDTLAVGYLLKPVKKTQLVEVLEKAKKLNKVQIAAARPAENTSQRKNISAKTRRGVELIPLENVNCFVADHKYVTVYHSEGETLIDDTLKDLEEEFNGSFVRVHRNALVAVNAIEGMERSQEGHYELRLSQSGYRPVVSRRHVSAVRDLLSQL